MTIAAMKLLKASAVCQLPTCDARATVAVTTSYASRNTYCRATDALFCDEHAPAGLRAHARDFNELATKEENATSAPRAHVMEEQG